MPKLPEPTRATIRSFEDPADRPAAPRGAKSVGDQTAVVSAQPAPAVDRGKKQRTFNLPIELIERAQGVVHYAQGSGEPEWVETMADLAREAIDRLVTEIEKDYNDGQPFPVPHRLRAGPGSDGLAKMHNARRGGS